MPQVSMKGYNFINMLNLFKLKKLQVIPAINVDSFEEAKEKIKLVEPYVDWVQLDVADGTFTQNTIWHNSSDLLSFKTPLKLEVHLMINNINEEVGDWLFEPVKRVIFHLETSKSPDLVIKKCREAKKEVGIAIGPDTPWTRLVPFCSKVDMFQILSVYPGLPGQKFIEGSVDKIKALRLKCPSAIIEVDGGVDAEVAKKVKEAGADIVCAASYIFKSDDIKRAIKELSI